ncbi:MAG: CapA family protein, partial [Chloroflexi bacterium]|nr:CapA family protein [Chloroflexota bacterium]
EMTVLMMTGVTAMVRSIAYRMETKGILYPGLEISGTLASADITHISNEIPFYSGCPYPDPVQQDLVFCSNPSYIELLRAVGADVIELTGNHFQDYGDEATLETLDMYNAEGWPYYGGGANLKDATKAITLTSNGNTLSFIGCNPVGPSYAWATAERPGAAPCNWEFMYSELNKLADEVDVPIATFQYDEIYEYEPTEQQKSDFRAMADAGARIVSGSQSHHPQAIEFHNGAFIHYGLGNLFFDQMQELGTRQEFIDRHVIYKGQHISTELLTFMLEDYAKPRPMTAEERAEALASVFAASGW